MVSVKEEIATLKRELRLKERDKILAIQSYIEKLPGAMIGDGPEYLAVNPLRHSFADGCYIREIFMPAGQLFVTKIHKIAHPFFVLKGNVEILTEDGMEVIKAPYHGITKPGTKRVIYTVEDTLWVTVHVTKERDLEKIEAEIIAKDFDEMDKISEQSLSGGLK